MSQCISSYILSDQLKMKPNVILNCDQDMNLTITSWLLQINLSEQVKTTCKTNVYEKTIASKPQKNPEGKIYLLN